MKCECKNTGILRKHMVHMYDEKKELPFVNHKSGECKCTNKLTQYHKDGKKVWLCSCCYMGEKEVK